MKALKNTMVAMAMTAVMIAGATSALASSVRPLDENRIVEANRSVRYYARQFNSGVGMVSLEGDGGSDLDLFVYDANGRLLAQDIGTTDKATVRWNQAEAGYVYIKVANKGTSWNRYRLTTN